jgi:hypothetical protein
MCLDAFTRADMLDPYLLQFFAPLIAESLTLIFNLTVISGTIPKGGKAAHVLPLPKVVTLVT